MPWWTILGVWLALNVVFLINLIAYDLVRARKRDPHCRVCGDVSEWSDMRGHVHVECRQRERWEA